MVTSLAAQLAQIAANSKSTLDVKAQKAAHSKSLIFEPRVAASQNFQTLYSICHEGFQELCQLDARFSTFGNTLFSEQSRDEDRTQMTATENAELDRKIDYFLRLVGARLRLMPAIKALEWLVRRFRIHEYNTSSLITTFLPYHTIPAFVTLLSILPGELPHVYRFLDPYVKSLTSPPRALLVHQAIHHSELLTTISTYTLETCKIQHQSSALIAFWGSVMTEVVNGKIDKLRSGRRSVQRSNDQDLLHQIGPTISEALVMSVVPSLQVACYMVISVFVAKGDLDDAAISALMEQLVAGWTPESLRPGLVCLSILAQYRSSKQLSSKVTRALLKIKSLTGVLNDVGKDHNIGRLANGFCLALIDRLYKKGDLKGLSIVESLLLASVFDRQQSTVIFQSLLLVAHKVGDQLDPNVQIRKALASTIVGLSQADDTALRDTFTQAINDTDIDVDELEMRLDTQLRPILLHNQPDHKVDMKVDNVRVPVEDFDSAVLRLKDIQTTSTSSCLRTETSDVFTDLCSVFLLSLAGPSNATAFENLSVLQRDSAVDTPLYFSFLMRIWCGPYPTIARARALDLARGRLKEQDSSSKDFQAVLPYCIAALSDPSKKVRRAAADLAAVLSKNNSDTSEKRSWGRATLYDNVEALQWMDADVRNRFLEVVVVPSLEECVLNADHILELMQSVLNHSSKALADGNEGVKKNRLPHGTRLPILFFLSSHIIYSPLLTLKLRLLSSLNQVKSVSGTSRTQLLAPMLEQWLSLSASESGDACLREHIDESILNQKIVEVVLPNDKDGVGILLNAIQARSLLTRQNLLQTIFRHIEKSWPAMKAEIRHIIAELMLTLSQQDWSDGRSLVSDESAGLLRSIDLPTDVLLFFLESLQPTTKMATDPPPGKRRRTSSSDTHRGISSMMAPELGSTLKQVTFVLQLVEGSEPAKHPELLNALFNTLSELQHVRAMAGSELGYLQNLVLRSLLAIVPAYKDNQTLKIDSTGGHGDLLINCIQKSSSPAVQNTALLLVAGLANVAPDLVLNSVMPIFTQMGSSVLRQSDDYSAHVINQTVKEVVPPLIRSLRKGKVSPLAGASPLLLSFVTAYEHIPSHRRLGLFVSLVETLGSDEFLYGLLAMLAHMYGATDQILGFATEVFNSFTVEIQLQSLTEVLTLIGDIFQQRPTLSSELLGAHERIERDPQKIGLRQLTLLQSLLSSRKLKTHISKLAKQDDMEAARIHELYSILLEKLLLLADTLKSHKTLYNRCGDALSKLLNLLSIGEFIKAVETLLDRPDPVLRRKVLRAVDVRIDGETQSDASSRAALLAFLPQLTAIIRVSDDGAFKHIAVGCVDKISEKYGKKDPEAVVAAAKTIAGDECLGQGDERLRVMALLCLASLVDVLQDGIVPILPSAIPKALSYMKKSFENGLHNTELHNASYAFITALAQYLPYMISGSYLEQLLAVSSASTAALLEGEANDTRLQCLQILAKQVDAKIMFSSLKQNWSAAAKSGYTAVREYLKILGIAIDKHPKSEISKNAATLSAIFLEAFDLRRTQLTRDSIPDGFQRNIIRIEESTNMVALKMVYKLNDATFRPIFSQLMDWAVSLPKTDIAGRNLRLLSVYGFLLSFFGNLKSIITSYASYIIDSAADVLRRANPRDSEERDLWSKVLQTLAKSFAHDQDDFWQAPAHFSAVAPVLTSQFTHASSYVDLAADLVPAVVELAAAADSQENQKELNGALLKHLRSPQASVRLAVVKCEQSLTDRLGEEWMAMLPEMLPYISELQDDDDEDVERETHRWIVGIESVLGESLDAMLQ